MANKSFLIKTTNIVWNLFMVGICALLTSGILIFLLLFVKFHLITFPLYLIAFLLIGPTMGAIFQTIFKMLFEIGIRVVRKYFYYYKKDFKDSLKLWIPYSVLILILCADIDFLASSEKGAYLLPMLFLILLLSMISYVYSLILYSRFIIRMRDIIKYSLYLVINRPVQSLSIVILIFILYQSFKYFGNFAIFWGVPMFAACTVLLVRNVLLQIEMKYVQ